MISVLCPSRGRPAQLAETCAVLRAAADNPDQVEILVAADADDPKTAGETLDSVTCLWIAPERYGYQRASRYWDELARLARGQWLLLWNDDATMVTPGWDLAIEENPPALLWPYTRADDPAGNYFPAWPKAWTDLLGYTSPVEGPHVDTYLTFLGKQLGRVRRIPVEIEHARPDYQHPGANDQTYREGRLLLGLHGMSPGWTRDILTQYAIADAAKIRAAGL